MIRWWESFTPHSSPVATHARPRAAWSVCCASKPRLLRRLRVDLRRHLANGAGEQVRILRAGNGIFLGEDIGRHAGDALVGGLLRIGRYTRDVLIGGEAL